MKVTALVSADDRRSQYRTNLSGDDDLNVLDQVLDAVRAVVETWKEDGCYVETIEIELTEEE